MLNRLATFLLVLITCLGQFAGGAVAAEETVRTPSEKMKEAVDKVNKTPATLGKSLQDLTNAAKEQLRQTFGGKAKTDTKASPADLNLPKKNPEAPAPAAELPEANRDPFRPMTLRTKVDNRNSRKRENLSPLERFELSQLKLVGIVWEIKEPRAMVEDSGGLGYVIKVSTPIGNNDGKVKAIYRNEVVVEEFYSDDYGVRKKRDVAMKLLSE